VAEKHPYMSGSGGLVQAVNHLRKSFPGEVSAETLKKLGIAPNNETYVINILRFIGVIDAEGRKTTKAASVFSKHEDAEFQKGFAELVQTSYKDLFQLHGSGAWTQPTGKLISFFRGADHTSAIVGQRQAGTFQALAGLSGHGDIPPASKAASVQAKKPKESAPKPKRQAKNGAAAIVNPVADSGNVGLTVRIEINLPAAGDQDTYDRIFKSIRENLLRGGQ